MMQERSHTYVIAPVGAEAAATILREATAVARKGMEIRVGVIESPCLRYDGAETDALPSEFSELPPDLAAHGGTILLGHDRMNRVIEVSKPDLLAVVQGGARYGGLAAASREAGLHFPHRPDVEMTIAEMVMDGTIFPTEGAFGRLRESILSLELVTPAGEIVRLGSRAVKDVGGYELIGFLLGQGGRCGFVSSVTLRLLPEPGCRAFVAGRGEVRMLKTLAHNARREFRPAETVIYESEAAALVADAWRDALGKRGETLPPMLEPGGGALLVSEIQGLESVVEEELHALAGTDDSGGACLALLDTGLFELSKRFLPAAFDRLKGRGSVLHVSYDGGAHVAPPAGSFVYRSLYPERINAIVSIGPVAAGARLIETIEADRPLRDFIAGLAGTGRGERIYVIERAGEALRRIRVPDEDLQRLVSEDDDGEGRARRETLRELTGKVLRAFDPELIMLP